MSFASTRRRGGVLLTALVFLGASLGLSACDPSKAGGAPAAPPTSTATTTASTTTSTTSTTSTTTTTTTTTAPTTTTTAAPAPPPPPPPPPPSTAARAPAAPAPSCANGSYVNADGNTVCRPQSGPVAPPGATARCKDGTYSFSQNRRGTCSGHGGVAAWL